MTELAALVRAVRLSPEGVPLSVNDSVAIAHRLRAGEALLAACEVALGAFEHNHAIDWDILQRAINLAKAAP